MLEVQVIPQNTKEILESIYISKGQVQVTAKFDFQRGEKILLKDVYVNGLYFRDHIWLKKQK